MTEVEELRSENQRLQAMVDILNHYYEVGELVLGQCCGLEEPVGVVFPYWIHDLFNGVINPLDIREQVLQENADVRQR